MLETIPHCNFHPSSEHCPQGRFEQKINLILYPFSESNENVELNRKFVRRLVPCWIAMLCNAYQPANGGQSQMTYEGITTLWNPIAAVHGQATQHSVFNFSVIMLHVPHGGWCGSCTSTTQNTKHWHSPIVDSWQACRVNEFPWRTRINHVNMSSLVNAWQIEHWKSYGCKVDIQNLGSKLTGLQSSW